MTRFLRTEAVKNGIAVMRIDWAMFKVENITPDMILSAHESVDHDAIRVTTGVGWLDFDEWASQRKRAAREHDSEFQVSVTDHDHPVSGERVYEVWIQGPGGDFSWCLFPDETIAQHTADVLAEMVKIITGPDTTVERI